MNGASAKRHLIRRIYATSPPMRAILYPFVAARRTYLRARFARRASQLDALVACLAEDPVLRVDEFEGIFAFDRRSHLFRRIVLEGQYEPELVRRFREYVNPHRDVIDVGANVGFFSVLAAKTVAEGRVLAIEPVPNALGRLRRNVTLNGVGSKVLIFEGAVSATPGRTNIEFVEGMEEYSSLGTVAHPAVAGATVRSTGVEVQTIDDLVHRNGLDPGFIKVDVEGMEHLVFAGASQVLANSRPVILSELSDPLLRSNGSSAAQVIAALKSAGYRVVDPLWPDLPPGKRQFGDVLCLPE